MIDDYNLDRTGWARFSEDRTMRYRLARKLTGFDYEIAAERRVVFVMLNSSTADAFMLDPTVRRCVGFAQRFGADYLEVVNLFALRSTDPAELYKRAAGARGDDRTNDEQILAACRGATKVIAGWGAHGELGDRGELVRRMLHDEGIVLHHLGLTKGLAPRHPLYLKASTELEVWAP